MHGVIEANEEFIRRNILKELGKTLEPFRGLDRWSMSETRNCFRWGQDEALELCFEMGDPPVEGLTLELVGMPYIFGSHSYVQKFLNGLLEVELNGTSVHSGLIHWRSHEETASFWQRFSFHLPQNCLRKGKNKLVLTNKTSKARLGEFYDVRVDEVGGETVLSTWFLAEISIDRAQPKQSLPVLAGLPLSAVEGEEFFCEVTMSQVEEIKLLESENAHLSIEPPSWELGMFRALICICPHSAGRRVFFRLSVGEEKITACVERVYLPLRRRQMVVGGGIESISWKDLPTAFEDIFANGHGNAVRISIDDYVNDFHSHTVEEWLSLVSFLARRGIYFAAQRLRVPPYSKISHADITLLARCFGKRYLGTSIPEPSLKVARPVAGQDLSTALSEYLEFFRAELKRVRIEGFPVVTFDPAGGLAGHYYAEGLDVHLAETGVASNAYEEICCRGAATAWGKPWGIVAAMMWYYGQGAQYGCDAARARLARLIAFSSYHAGASQILWEGGVFDNKPVYQYALTPESWKDYERELGHPVLQSIRKNFKDLLDYDRAQQLPPPKVSHAFLQGENDLFHGVYRSDWSAGGDLALARSWRMLTVFYPHLGARRGPVPHDAPVRRWFSWTPFGQADVTPATSLVDHFSRYLLLAFAGWNTMTEALYERLLNYAKAGGTLFLSLPHLTMETSPTLDWKPFREGDFEELCGVRLLGPGRRVECIDSCGFLPGLSDHFELSPKNPLFPEDFDEAFPVFGHDVSYLSGEIKVAGGRVHSISQAGEPILIENRVGNGRVFLLNTWFLPGRGKQLDYARMVLHSLLLNEPDALRLEDLSERVAWWEYPVEGVRHFVFLQTDWASEEAVSPVTFHIDGRGLAFDVKAIEPLHLYWDGKTAAIARNPLSQVREWKPLSPEPLVTVTPGQDPCFETLVGPQPRLQFVAS